MHKTIILADDHILLRDALVSLIDSFAEFSVVRVAADGTELVREIESGTVPDMVVLDLAMPRMDGYETAAWLKMNHPQIRIVVLTMYDSEIALIRLLQVGVRAFLKKDIHPTDLKIALLSVANDGYFYSHETTGKLGSLFEKSCDNHNSVDKSMLSEKEIKFIKYACSELTYKEIAMEMKLTPRIVDNYRDSLFDKLNVKSRVGLALYAVKNGLVSF